MNSQNPDPLSYLQTSAPEETIRTGKVEIERKTFYFALKENSRGRFLRITEEAKGRRNSVMIPAPGLQEFLLRLEKMRQTEK